MDVELKTGRGDRRRMQAAKSNTSLSRVGSTLPKRKAESGSPKKFRLSELLLGCGDGEVTFRRRALYAVQQTRAWI
jgi:hypothetical protein